MSPKATIQTAVIPSITQMLTFYFSGSGFFDSDFLLVVSPVGLKELFTLFKISTHGGSGFNIDAHIAWKYI